MSRNDPALTKLDPKLANELDDREMMIKTFASKQCSTESAAMFAEVCIEYWETIAFLCPREIIRESENALHLRADSGSTFAELRVLDQKSGSTLFEIS